MANKATIDSGMAVPDSGEHPKNPLRQRRTNDSDVAAKAGFRNPSNKRSKASRKKTPRRKAR